MAPSRGHGLSLMWCLNGGPRDSTDSLPLPSTSKGSGVDEGGSSTSSPLTAAGRVPEEPWDSANQGGGQGPQRTQRGRNTNNQVVPFHEGANGDATGRSSSEHAGTHHLRRPGHRHAPELRRDSITVDSFIDTTPHTPGEPLTGEQLQASRGFKLFTASTVTSMLPNSNVAPLTFLVLDVVQIAPPQPKLPGHTGGAPTKGAAAAAGGLIRANDPGSPAGIGAGAGEYRNRLVPMYVNSYCRTYFKIKAPADYVGVIQKLLKRDPMLTFALQKAVRHVRAGDSKSVSHVTPDPSGQSSSLYGMRLTPCVWRQDGKVLPALMVEHNLPYDSDVVMPRLMRDYAVLSHVPAILTLIDFEGKVLYQNASSLEYMGDQLSAKFDSQVQDGLLQVLFMFDVHSLEAMLEDVLHGNEWQGVVQVPYSLQHLMGQQQDTDTVIDFVRTLDDGAAGPSGRRGDDDGGDDEFQIGGGGRIPRKPVHSIVALNKQSSMTHQHRRSDPNMLDAVGGAGGGGGDLSRASPEQLEQRRPSVLDMAPGMQQRKFMSLLDKQPASNPGARNGRPSEAQAAGDDGGEDGDGDGIYEDEEGDLTDLDLEPECYHELHAIPLLDPVLDKQVIMLVQTDVTPRVELENKLADLTDAQLSMLEQLFPRHIIEYMLARVPNKVGRNLRDLANKHEQVMVLFCDVVGFTSMSKEVEASQVMHFLNELYEAFDGLVDEHSMYKLDIVGDCYIVVAGLIKEDQDGFVCVEELGPEQIAKNAQNIMQFAKAMLRIALTKPVLMPHNSQPVSLRIGIHTGPLVSGLVGSKMPKFTLFGDTMNTASRMESTCRTGCIHVSELFAKLLPNETWESTGGVQVKGKGLMSTFLWVPDPASMHLGGDDATDSEHASHGTHGTRGLNKSSTMQSSISTKSRLTSRSNSAQRRRESQTSGDHPLSGSLANNPLLKILDNIRGGDDGGDGGGDNPAGTMGGGARPKSGRLRMVRARGEGGRSGYFPGGASESVDGETRRQAITEAGFASGGRPSESPSFRNFVGMSRRGGGGNRSGASRRASYMEFARESYLAAELAGQR